jgi:hypothetical protein
VGETVALFVFINQYYDSYFQFTLNLIQVYREIKERGEAFEVVLINDEGETNFFKYFECDTIRRFPWLGFSL